MEEKMTIMQASCKLHEKWMELTDNGVSDDLTKALSIAENVLSDYDSILHTDILFILNDIKLYMESIATANTDESKIKRKCIALVESRINKIKNDEFNKLMKQYNLRCDQYIKPVTLDDILSSDDCTYVGDSEDGIFQFYFFKTGKTYEDGYLGIIDKDIVLEYFRKKEDDNEGRETV